MGKVPPRRPRPEPSLRACPGDAGSRRHFGISSAERDASAHGANRGLCAEPDSSHRGEHHRSGGASTDDLDGSASKKRSAGGRPSLDVAAVAMVLLEAEPAKDPGPRTRGDAGNPCNCARIPSENRVPLEKAKHGGFESQGPSRADGDVASTGEKEREIKQSSK